MKVRGSSFTLTVVSLMFVGMLVLGIPVSGFALEPHLCVNNNHISTNWENLGGVTTIYFAAKTCGHTSNTTYWKFTVRNYDPPYTIYCQDLNGGNGYPVSAEDPRDLPCPNLPTNNPNLRIRVTIDYLVTGSGTWMPHPDLVKNFH